MANHRQSAFVLFEGAEAERERIICQFENAWRSGERPDIEHILAGDSSVTDQVLPELVHIDLERKLKAGDDVHVESYLSRFPQLAEQEQPVCELIAAEFSLRKRRDPSVDTAEYLKRFPQFADRLRGVLSRDPISKQRSPSVSASGASRDVSEENTATLRSPKEKLLAITDL